SPRNTTLMESMFGEWTGKVRSTPMPKDILRTVKVSRTPPPWRRMTTPLNSWMRSFLPSTILTLTSTVSPARKSGMSSRSDAASTLSRMFMESFPLLFAWTEDPGGSSLVGARPVRARNMFSRRDGRRFPWGADEPANNRDSMPRGPGRGQISPGGACPGRWRGFLWHRGGHGWLDDGPWWLADRPMGH